MPAVGYELVVRSGIVDVDERLLGYAKTVGGYGCTVNDKSTNFRMANRMVRRS
jgi:hypothetical protein